MLVYPLHYPTCQVWRSNHHLDCDCPARPPLWCVRKLERVDGRPPWLVFRWTSDKYDLFMHAPTFESAMRLVLSMTWLSTHLRSDESA